MPLQSAQYSNKRSRSHRKKRRAAPRFEHSPIRGRASICARSFVVAVAERRNWRTPTTRLFLASKQQQQRAHAQQNSRRMIMHVAAVRRLLYLRTYYDNDWRRRRQCTRLTQIAAAPKRDRPSVCTIKLMPTETHATHRNRFYARARAQWRWPGVLGYAADRSNRPSRRSRERRGPGSPNLFSSVPINASARASTCGIYRSISCGVRCSCVCVPRECDSQGTRFRDCPESRSKLCL